jgi:hypothetical protein
LEEAMALSFEFVNNCKPGDLLRVKIEDTAEFAILGANEGHGLPALVALKDNYGSLVSAWYKQPVYDTAEKRVGTVADMLFSADGSINAVMLDVGGFMGLGQKHVAVPLSAISLTKKKNKSWLTINTTKEAVKSASGYSYDKKDGVWNPK